MSCLISCYKGVIEGFLITLSFWGCFFSVWLLSVLRGHLVFFSPTTQRLTTSDFDGFLSQIVSMAFLHFTNTINAFSFNDWKISVLFSKLSLKMFSPDTWICHRRVFKPRYVQRLESMYEYNYAELMDSLITPWQVFPHFACSVRHSYKQVKHRG